MGNHCIIIHVSGSPISSQVSQWLYIYTCTTHSTLTVDCSGNSSAAKPVQCMCYIYVCCIMCGEPQVETNRENRNNDNILELHSSSRIMYFMYMYMLLNSSNRSHACMILVNGSPHSSQVCQWLQPRVHLLQHITPWLLISARSSHFFTAQCTTFSFSELQSQNGYKTF